MKDTELVSLAINGGGDKNDAYGELVRRHTAAAVASAYYACGDERLAEDAAQEAFVNCWFRLESLSDPEKFGGWVCRSARNRALNMLRGHRPVPFDDLLNVKSDAASPETVFLRRERDAEIRSAVASLPAELEETVRRYYYLGHSVTAIAESMNAPVGTVKSRLWSARNKLKQLLGHMSEIKTSKEKASDMKGNEKAASMAEKVAADIKKLQNFYRDSDFNNSEGLKTEIGKLEKSLDALETSPEKTHLAATIYDMKSNIVPDDKKARDKALRAAEESDNAEVLCRLYLDNINMDDKNELAAQLSEKFLPRIREIGERRGVDVSNQLAALSFWLGYAYQDLGRLDDAHEAYAFTQAHLSGGGGDYYSNGSYIPLTAAALRSLEVSRDESVELIGINCDCCGIRDDGGALYLNCQPGYSMNAPSGKGFSMNSILYFSQGPDGLYFNKSMREGDVIVSKANSAETMRVVSLSETVTVAAGEFECMHVAIKDAFSRRDVWYTEGVGIVKLSDGLYESYELQSYIHAGGDGYLPRAEGNKWVYRNVMLPPIYETAAELSCDYVNGAFAYIGSIFYAGVKKGADADMLDSDYYINKAMTLSDKTETLEEAVSMLKRAVQSATSQDAIAFSIGAIKFIEKNIKYRDDKWRLLPSSYSASNIVMENGVPTFSDGLIWSAGPYRFGSRSAENKIFGVKITRWLSEIYGALWLDEWKDGYRSEMPLPNSSWPGEVTVYTSVDSVGTVTTAAGTFENCLCVTADAKVNGAGDGFDYFGNNYNYVSCGVKRFTYAPNVGVVRLECNWGDGFMSRCELTEYATMSTDGEYMPVQVGNRWIYDETTIEAGYTARRTMEIAAVTPDKKRYLLLSGQDFIYNGTDAEYEAFKASLK